MMQQIKDPDNIHAYVKNAMKQELKAGGMVIELQNLDDWARGFFGKHQAVDAVHGALDASFVPEDMTRKTKEELEAAAADLTRNNRDILRALPTEELGWPGISNQAYFNVIDKAVGE